MKTTGTAVEVKRVVESGRCYFEGVHVCGSVWTCPVCSAKIAARRGDEIKRAGLIWAEMGGSVCMVTYTIQHNAGDRLGEMIDCMERGYRTMKSGRAWQGIKANYQIRGSITGSEITIGENGWHYHKHEALFVSLPIGFDTKEMQEEIQTRYIESIKKFGLWAAEGIAVKVTEVVDPGKGLELYCAKWGIADELQRSESKDSVSPFDLLDHPENKRMWREYVEATKGRRRLVWSKCLRSLLGLGKDKTDQEVAEEKEDQPSEVVYRFTAKAWKRVMAWGTYCDILDAAEGGYLQEWLFDRGFSPGG